MLPPTRVINIARVKPPDRDYVYIGRPSKWGNRNRVTRDCTREQAIALYERDVRGSPELLAALPELVGKTLGCTCAPKACHGHVLVRLLRERGLERLDP